MHAFQHSAALLQHEQHPACYRSFCDKGRCILILHAMGSKAADEEVINFSFLSAVSRRAPPLC